MNKFPMLNNLKLFFAFISVIILIIGSLLAVTVADAMGTNINSSQRQLNVLAGVIVFVITISFASGFLLIAELISLSLRIEDHLEKIKDTLSRSAPNTPNMPTTPPKTLNTKTYTPQNVTNTSEPKNYSFPSTDSYHPQTGDYSINLPVKAYQLHVFKHPSVQSDVLITLTNAKHVMGFKRDDKMLWICIEVEYNNSISYGWVKTRELDVASEQLENLPQVRL